MPNPVLYNGIARQIKNQAAPNNLREDVLSKLITWKKELRDLNASLLLKADDRPALEAAQKTYTDNIKALNVAIKENIAHIKKFRTELANTQRQLDAIPLSQDEEEALSYILALNPKDKDDKPHIQRWIARQEKIIAAQKAKRDEKDTTVSLEEKRLLKYKLYTDKKYFAGEISTHQSQLKSNRVERKNKRLLLQEVTKLLTIPDYKNVLTAQQDALIKELSTWIKKQDVENLQRVNNYKSYMTFVEQARDAIKNYIPSMPGNSERTAQEHQELTQEFNIRVKALLEHIEASEKTLAEIGINFDELPAEAKIVWQRAQLADKLLENDFNPYLLPEIRAKALIKRLKAAGVVSGQTIKVYGQPCCLLDVLEAALAAYLAENEKYKQALKDGTVPDLEKMQERYQELSNICESCMFPLVGSLNKKRNWLDSKSLDEKPYLPWKEANAEVENEIHKASGETIRLAMRNFYITKKMSVLNPKNIAWLDEYDFAKGAIDDLRKNHGVAIDVLSERFPGIGRVNEAISLMSNARHFRELTLEHDVLSNKYKLASLGFEGSLAFIQKFDKAYNEMIKTRRALANAKPKDLNNVKEAQYAFIQAAYEYLSTQTQCKNFIRKNAPNITKLQSSAESKRAAAEIKQGLNNWKTAEILNTIKSEWNKSPLLPWSHQADYLLAQYSEIEAKLTADNIKTISESNFNAKVLKQFNDEFKSSPVALLKDFSRRLKLAEDAFAWKWFGHETSSHKVLIRELELLRAFTLKSVTRYCMQQISAGEDLPPTLPAALNPNLVTPASKAAADPAIAATTPAPAPNRFWRAWASIKTWWKGDSSTIPAAKPVPVATAVKSPTASTPSATTSKSSDSWFKRLFTKDKTIKPAVSADPVDKKVTPASSHPEKFFTEGAGADSSLYQVEQDTEVFPSSDFDSFTKQPETATNAALASFTAKGTKLVHPGTFGENQFQGHTLEVKNKQEIKWVERRESGTKNIVSEVWVVPENMKLGNIFKKCVRDMYLTGDKQAIDDQHVINQVLDVCVKELTQENMGLITKENILKALSQYKEIVASLTQKSGSSYFTSSKLDKLATELAKAYKDTSEQSYGVPYLGKCKAGLDIVMRHAPCRLPSDTLLTLALRELDSFIKAQGAVSGSKTLLITRSWDPAYVKALMLCCELRNRYEDPRKKVNYLNVTGFPIPSITEAEITALEWRLAEKNAAKHDLGVLGKKLAEKKEIASPLSQLGEEFHKSLLKVKS